MYLNTSLKYLHLKRLSIISAASSSGSRSSRRVYKQSQVQAPALRLKELLPLLFLRVHLLLSLLLYLLRISVSFLLKSMAYVWRWMQIISSYCYYFSLIWICLNDHWLGICLCFQWDMKFCEIWFLYLVIEVLVNVESEVVIWDGEN